MSEQPKDPAARSSKDLYAEGYMPAGEMRWCKRRAVSKVEDNVLGAHKLEIAYINVLQQLWVHTEPMKGQRWQNVPSVEFKVQDLEDI